MGIFSIYYHNFGMEHFDGGDDESEDDESDDDFEIDNFDNFGDDDVDSSDDIF